MHSDQNPITEKPDRVTHMPKVIPQDLLKGLSKKSLSPSYLKNDYEIAKDRYEWGFRQGAGNHTPWEELNCEFFRAGYDAGQGVYKHDLLTQLLIQEKS